MIKLPTTVHLAQHMETENVPIESIQHFRDFVKGVHASDVRSDSKTSEVFSN